MATLRRFSGMDLREVSISDAGEIVRAAFLSAGGSAHYPLYIAEMDTDFGTHMTAYVEREPVDDDCDSIGDQAIRISVLPQKGLAFTLPAIRIGDGKTWIKSISTLESQGIQHATFDCLEILTTRGISPNVTRRVYMFTNLEPPWCLSLVRCETAGTQVGFGNYYPRSGSWISDTGLRVYGARSAQEWVDRLKTGSVSQIMSILYFLCGTHAGQDEAGIPGVVRQIPEALALLRDSEMPVLKRLLKHDNQWIREYSVILQQKALAHSPAAVVDK